MDKDTIIVSKFFLVYILFDLNIYEIDINSKVTFHKLNECHFNE